jgi:glutamine cyclotransferase
MRRTEPVSRRRARRGWLIGTGAAVCCGAGIAVWGVDRTTEPQVFGYEVVNEFPHDPKAYCQGLVFADGVLYEGTGQYGKSTLRKVELETGQPLKTVDLDRRHFGEGITLWKDQILQLTWKERTGLVYDKQTLTEVSRFRYNGEGWGLTHDEQHLIVSDGSPTLRFLDPQSFRVVRRLTVQHNGQRMSRLNELEYMQGEVYANVWYQDYILRISPQSGAVTGWIDLRNPPLYPDRFRRNRDEVFNGIAYDAVGDRLFVTGKNWPKLFEIRLRPRS